MAMSSVVKLKVSTRYKEAQTQRGVRRSALNSPRVLRECLNKRRRRREGDGTSRGPGQLAATDPFMGYAINKAVKAVDDFSKSKRKKPEYNGTFALVLANLVVFAAGKLGYPIQALMLAHYKPQWYQFLTSIFCHATWDHLSSNLFLLYIFGKLVEEEEGVTGVVVTYFVCGIFGAIASLVFMGKNAVSLGASGAVFGLFAVSVLVKLSLNPKKLIESAIVGQFVFQQVRNEVKMQTGRLGSKAMAGGAQISHVAHLAGALAGVLLIILLSRLPSAPGSK